MVFDLKRRIGNDNAEMPKSQLSLLLAEAVEELFSRSLNARLIRAATR